MPYDQLATRVTVSPSGLGGIEETFSRYVDMGALPGFAVTVSQNGRVIYEAKGGCRDVEMGLPIDLDTLCRVFSLSKVATSIGALLLVDRGTLGLGDPIGRYLPEL